jgi:hypothetical protein
MISPSYHHHIKIISRSYQDHIKMLSRSTCYEIQLYDKNPPVIFRIVRARYKSFAEIMYLKDLGKIIISVSVRQDVNIVRRRPISPFVPYNVSCPRHHSVLIAHPHQISSPYKTSTNIGFRQLTAITHSTSTPNSLSMPSPSNGTILPNFVFAGRNEEGNCGMNSARVLCRCLEGRGSCGERQNRRDEISVRENPKGM